MAKRAGVIPFIITENKEIKMYFMKPSDAKYGGPCFQIAKGRVGVDEDDETTALREGEEELGLKQSNIESFFMLGKFLNDSHTIYLAKLSSDDEKHFNEVCHETGATAWLTLDEYKKEDIGRLLHLPIVEDAIETICRLEDI